MYLSTCIYVEDFKAFTLFSNSGQAKKGSVVWSYAVANLQCQKIDFNSILQITDCKQLDKKGVAAFTLTGKNERIFIQDSPFWKRTPGLKTQQL